MDSKFYVSLEAARLLKEKGYDEKTDFFIDEYGIWKWDGRAILDLPCPTKAEAMDWLESKGYRIIIIYDWIECKWYFKIINGSPTIMNITELEVSDSVFYKTRLEAEDAAIITALELILEKENNYGKIKQETNRE
jgi:hypothetical protein